MRNESAVAEPVPVTFLNKDGRRLFGMLHQPTMVRATDAAILLLSPGIKARVAPHRLYIKMAERFAALGYPVLRFDFFGLGDSEGELEETLLSDVYGAIQVGRYIGDTISAMDWMQENYGISRFVAAGLCGGAITGLLAAERDPRITGLIALAIPVILDGSRIDFTKYMTDAQLRGTRAGYLRKFRLWDAHVWRSWLRFLTFQSHYSLIARSALRPMLRRFRRAEQSRGSTAAQVDDNSNPYFTPAFLRMVSTSRRILLLFAGADRLTSDFDVKFMQRHRESLRSFAPWFETHVTPLSNHIFSLPEWQNDMVEQCCRWLERERIERPGLGAGARVATRVPLCDSRTQ